MLSRFQVLLPDFNRIGNSNLLERLVPIHNPLANPTAIANRSRMLDIEDDWLFRWTHAQLFVSLLQVPAVDVTHVRVVRAVLSIVRISRCEVADPLVRFAWRVTGATFNLAD